MKVLGISAFYHDSAACLVADGRIVAAAEEERFSRRKHDSSFPAGLPAVTHADGSARIQTVDESSPPAFRALLQEMDRRFGCPVILNTSFNVRGEPMVCTPEEAFACFRRAGLDGLFLENLFIDKNDLAELPALPAEEAGPMELD